MQGSKGQNAIRPVALGASVNSGAYGQTIPLLYGMTAGTLFLIWMANIRQGSAKKSKKNKGAPDYVANADFLVGHNPIMEMLQAWVNQNQWLILNFAKYTYSSSFIGPATLTVPDDMLYAVIAVTITIPYSATFNDYGGQGESTQSGTYEVPLWNAAYNGPDPVHASGQRNSPYTYWWLPTNGRTIQLPYAPQGAYPAGGYDINVYYAQIPNEAQFLTSVIQGPTGLGAGKSGANTPMGALNLEFENSLGDGSEFTGTDSTSGNPLSDEQIIYPHYAGLGSQSFAMGSSQTFPEVKPELLGTFPVNPTGDADFADMVEDLFYGATQAGFHNDNPQTPIQHGLNCGQRPGTVQQVNFEYTAALDSSDTFIYPLPNYGGYTTDDSPPLSFPGDWLVVCVSGQFSSPPSISDTADNDWTPVFSANNNYQVWYAQAKAYNVNGQGTVVTIAMDATGEANTNVTLLEIAGVDTLDSVVTAAGNSASVTATGAQGTPMYILAFGDYNADQSPGTVNPPTLWQYILDPDTPSGTVLQGLYRLQSRIVQWPGTYKYTAPTVNAGPFHNVNAAHVALLAFKCSQPPNYPPALGNIIGDIVDKPSLQIVRNQCRAAGLWGSLYLDSQTKGSDIIGQLYEALDAWPVWSGFSLKSIARSEVSAVGNGAIYTAPTASGPVANLRESDFNVGKKSDTPPVEVTRKAQVNIPNLLSVQHPNRASQYNDIVVSQPESGAIALYGPRKDSPKMMRMFQDPAVSRMYLDIQVRLANYVRNGYEFPVNAKWKLLEPGDLITIPFAATMPNSQGPGGTVPVPYVPIPVRILEVEEDESYNLKITAEPFIYGTYAPVQLPATAQQGYVPQSGGNPGSVNIPVIFEPVPRLAGGNTQNELWLVVSGGALTGSPPVYPDYGGCFVYVSTDGGVSYSPVAPLVGGGSVVGGEGQIPSNALLGSAITGWLIEQWAAAPSPDSTNDLYLDLSESLGQLDSYSVADEDADTYPCYVSGGATQPTYQQSCSTAAHNVGSATKAFPNANTGGNTIFVIVAAYQDEPLGVNVTDSNDNAYLLLCETTPIANFGPYSRVYAYAAVNVTGAGNSVQVAFNSGSGDILFAALEYADVQTSGSPPDALVFSASVNQVANFGDDDGATPLSTGSVSVTVPGGLMLAFAYNDANNTLPSIYTPTINGGMWALRESPTLPEGEDQSVLAVWDVNESVTSAQSASLTANAFGDFHVGIIETRPAVQPIQAGIPYELMTYAVAELTGPNPYQYVLKATPSGSPPEANHLDRGVYGAPAPGEGVNHPGPLIFDVPLSESGTSRFAFVGPPYTGIMKIALDPSWIGKTLYFKFAACNSYIANVQDLSDCTPYPYTPTGSSGSSGPNPGSYTVSPTPEGSPPVAPAAALSNPTATTIDMAQVTVQFASNAVNYNPRTFTIPDPTAPTTYYVTITDPGYTGDQPGETNLPAICQTSNALVGVPGNTYIGSIVALPGGGGTVVGPGGSGGVDSFELLVNGA